jgi:glycosyltransferase involved in cell wall biosynthesis
MQSTYDFHLIVFTDTFFETNGVGSYYRTVLDWARQNGHARVHVVCPARDEEDLKPQVGSGDHPDDVIPVRPLLPFRNPFYPDLILGHYRQSTLRGIVEAMEGPKVIHIATSGPLGAAAAKLAKRMNLTSVGYYHTDLQECARLYGRSVFGARGDGFSLWIGRLFDRRAYGRCAAMIVPSDFRAKRPRTFFKGEITVIPFPIDVSRFHPGETREGAFRERYGEKGKVLAIVVGRVAREKNPELVCRYLGRDERVKTVFVGDGPCSAALRRKWNATVTGFLKGDDLLAAYQQADVFVQLSVAEGFGLALVEAMASGLPAVVLHSPGLVGQFPPESGVEVIEEDELLQLGGRCVALVEDRPRYERYSTRAIEFVGRLSADHVLPQFIEFHREFAH